MKILILHSNSKADAETAKKITGWIQEANHSVVSVSDPGFLRLGDHHFTSLLDAAGTVDGAIAVVGAEPLKDKKTSDAVEMSRETLLIFFGVLVGRMNLNRAVVCLSDRDALPEALNGITVIFYGDEVSARAESKVGDWLNRIGELPQPTDHSEATNQPARFGQLSDLEKTVLRYMLKRHESRGYTTHQMIEEYVFEKQFNPVFANASIHSLIEKNLIRRENINRIKTYFMSDAGLKMAYDNVKKLSVQPREFELVSEEIEQSDSEI